MKVIIDKPKNKLSHIPKRPKGISERTYRKHMARTIKETIQGVEFEFAMPSYSWLGKDYLALDTATPDEKADMLFRQVIISPEDVADKGIEAVVFDGGYNIPLITEVQKRITAFFLRPTVVRNKGRSTPGSQA